MPSSDDPNFDISVRAANGKRLAKGTKVWSAVRIENGEEVGPLVASKDCWVRPDHVREGDTIRHILQYALKSQAQDQIDQSLMNVEWHGDVFIEDRDEEPILDSTRTFAVSEASEDSASNVHIPRLVHYRMVLTGIGGNSVEYATCLPSIYQTLAQAATSLQLLHETGWVHRDVSTGNILSGDRHCLIDCEYAKKASDTEDFSIVCISLMQPLSSSLIMIQGSKFFKSVEVDQHVFAHKPRPPKPAQPRMSIQEHRDLARNVLSKDLLQYQAKRVRPHTPSEPPEEEKYPSAGQSALPPPADPEPPVIPFRYNPLHDLESLWWVAVYFLLKREMRASAPDTLDHEDTAIRDREEQRKYADELHPVARALEDLRQDLVARYTEVEKDPASIDFTCAGGLHERFVAAFQVIAENPDLKDITVSIVLRGAVHKESFKDITDVVTDIVVSTNDADSQSTGHRSYDTTQQPNSSHERGFNTPFGRSREIPIQQFLERALPQLQHGLEPARVVETIKHASMPSCRKILTNAGRWRGFAKDPSLYRHSVFRTFSHLEGIVHAITDASSLSSSRQRPTLHFENNSEPITAYEHRSEPTFPDAFFLKGDERVWAHIAVCGEYQKEDTPYHVKNNVSKVTQSMANCIRQDPRRRFVFGFTIENCDMKLWYCDRRNILASQPFNFVTGHLTLVHFFLSVLYAEPHQLGWDDTMKLLPDGLNYDITVRSGGQNRTYRTQKLLADKGSRYVIGKGTRVWRAVLIEDEDEKGPPIALKDCWVALSRTREGEILRQIRRDILASSPDDQELVECLFPAAEWDGDVLTYYGEPDLTIIIPEHISSVRDVSEQEDCTSSRASSHGAFVHYRLILSPASERPVEHESSAVLIYKTLANATAAKLFSSSLRVQGTVWFKAFEITKERYIFRPSPELSPPPPVPEEIPEGEIQETEPQSKIPLIVPVCYNPLHDLESLWWVAVYFLLKKELHDLPEPPETDVTQVWDRERQRVYASDAFSNRGTRFSIMVTNNFRRDALEVIHPSMRPVLRELNNLRRALVERYTEVEKDPRSIPFDCAKGLYDTFIDGFFKIAQDQKMRSIKLGPLASPPPPIRGVSKSLPQPPEVEHQDHKEDTRVQHLKIETKGAGEPRRLRKNSIVVSAVHHYNLRPRPVRK
ncbi:hypothetical protein EIP86_010385 [Pleurotus ostreatoroseus]|nr:hypothetical protein EIP86_010385 [Pleurotus ostreatoroseus]